MGNLLLSILIAFTVAQGQSAFAETSAQPPENPPEPAIAEPLLAAPDAKPSAEPAPEHPNYHLVGWLNTILPGSGQILLGHPVLGASQAALEIGTFGYGYSLSRFSPMTIDGVPEDLDVESGNTVFSNTNHTSCAKWNTKHTKCLKTGPTSTNSTSSVEINSTPTDESKAGFADILQEFGLKYHMVNVFNAYREAAGSPEIGQGIDMRDTGELFMDPFRWSTLSDPWVFSPLLALMGYTIYDYISSIHSGLTALQPMTGFSNQLLAFNYEVWQPFGSGAPEEMFYRGFFQNEMYSLVPNSFFSIGMSTLAFSFSHAAPGRLTAAVAGGYLGFLADHFHGNLAPGITVHFWTVVLLGIETIALTDRAQGFAPLKYVSFGIDL